MNREKRIANTLLAGFSATSLLLLFLPLSTPVQALKAGVAYVLNPIPFHGAQAVERLRAMPSSISQLISADIQNRELRAENRNFALVKAELDSYKAENERLRSQMGLKAPPGRLVVWARVMEREPLNWNRFVLVDVGEVDGIEVNSPVLGVHGQTLAAVGRITDVGPRWSKVLLLTDEQSAVAGYTAGDKPWEGLVEGRGGNNLKMSYLPAEAQFAIGQLVRTSATSATFPADVLIGSISKVYVRDPFLTFQSVEVSPAVQAGLLKEVLIVVRQKAGDPDSPSERRHGGASPRQAGDPDSPSERRHGGAPPRQAGES